MSNVYTLRSLFSSSLNNSNDNEDNDNNDDNDKDDDDDDNNNDDNSNNNNHDNDNSDNNNNDNSNDNKNYFSLIPQQFGLSVFSKLVSWLSKLLLKAGDIAENLGPVIRYQNCRKILSFRSVMAVCLLN
jgi:hypothetical protein